MMRTNFVRIIVGTAVLAASGAMTGTVLARHDTPLLPRYQQSQRLDQVKQPVVNINIGARMGGEVSKQQPKNRPTQYKSGDRDAKVPAPSNWTFASAGK